MVTTIQLTEAFQEASNILAHDMNRRVTKARL